jgi:hypothetical protein
MSRWSEYKEKNGVTPLDLLNPMSKHAEIDVSNDRYEICLACPELIKLTKQCKQCGCVMTAKTKLEKAKCPIGKW